MSGQFLEVEPSVERPGCVVASVEDHGDEGERPAGLETIAEGTRLRAEGDKRIERSKLWGA
jgi:hypothetical protein